MAATLDTKGLHVARMLAGLREDLKRNLLTELNSTSAPVCQPEFVPSNAGAIISLDEDLQQSLAQANHHYQTASWVPDERFALGRPLLKKLVYRLLSFYTARQTGFNMALVRIVNALNAKMGYFGELVTHHQKELRALRMTVEKLSAQVNLDFDYKLTRLEVLQRKLISKTKIDLETRMESLLRPARSLGNGTEPSRLAMAEGVHRSAPSAPNDSQTLSHLSESYFAFIDKFRGDSEEIRRGLHRYTPYFDGAKHVLDIGCGRGEFLEVCKERHIHALGIDINEDMILYCHRKGLEAAQDSALDYLNGLDDKSLDGIFMSYVAEHMGAYELINVLSAAYSKLQFNSYIVIQALNPTSLYTLSNNFYLDLLHVRPIHPQALALLLESCGFRNLKVEYLLPVPSDFCLQRLEPGGAEASPDAYTAMYNMNVDKLNEILFGYQAYAIVGRK